MKSTTKTLALSITFAAALAACGGGGGGTATTATTPPPAPVANSTIVTSVPVATYAAGSDERIAYDYLNAERKKCGFGLLAQDTRLDAAAAAHVSYEIANNETGHSETPGRTGFTGVDPSARALSKGYPSPAVGEQGAFDKGGLANIRGLLAAPYHLANLTIFVTDVGLSYQSTTLSQLVSNALFLNLGYKGTTVQLPNAGTVLTYPCDGVAASTLSFFEDINWASPVGTGSGGAPVFVTAPNGEALVIVSASVTPAGGGVVPVVVLTADNDPQKRLRKGDAFIIPPSSLSSNTSYRVQITGTVSGVPFGKDFTFETGS